MSLMGISFLYELQHCVTCLIGHCVSIISVTFPGHPQQANELLHLLADGEICKNDENAVESPHVSTNHYHSMLQAYLLYLYQESLLQCILRQLELPNLKYIFPL